MRLAIFGTGGVRSAAGSRGVRHTLLKLTGYFRLMGYIRSSREIGPKARQRFARGRSAPPYQAAFDDPAPLVTVCIGTFNRAALLTERAIPSVLNQTYKRLELIVVGDACTDDTEARVARIDDPRLKFLNLPVRGDYPIDPMLRWMVAGTAPVNHALSMANGAFITHLDDDDEFALNRVEILLDTIRQHRADLVFHPFENETVEGAWEIRRARTFSFTNVSTGTIFYHRWFREIPWDPLAYRYGEPGDWNRLRKFKYLGAKTVRSPQVLLKHYQERSRADTAHQ